MNTFLFDLDGTLLPMDQEAFIGTYFKALAMKLAPYGLEPQTLIKAVWAGTEAMIENDGTKTNEERFWEIFGSILGEEVRNLEPVFEEFYRIEFMTARKETSTQPLARECISLLRKKGYRLILATNPVFPGIATISRIHWAGLEKEDFSWITTYENSCFCKPNIRYYEEIIQKTGVNPMDCIMIGNDVKDDMCTKQLGMQTYLLTDCLINTAGEDISKYKYGDFQQFFELVKHLPDADING